MGYVEYEVRDRVASIVLSRPEKLNAMTNAGIEELNETMRRFDLDDSAHIAILSGSGRAFCTGADVNERLLPSATAGAAAHYLPSIEEPFLNPMNWKPVIAAVHGYALGKGLSLALHCDLVVASADAKFQLTEISLGVSVAHYWSLLARRGHDAFANDVALTGRLWDAQEAFTNGLVNRVVAAGRHVEAAEEIAAQILANPPLAVRATVALRRRTLREDTTHANLMAIGHRWDLSEDYKESIQAKIDKRPPVFKGR